MKIVVGLGNPGKQYEQTRHNVGWMVLDRLAERAGWTGNVKARDAAATVFGRYRGLDVMLVKPTTYMNESGIAVRKVVARERAPLDDLLVVVDDFALPFGRLRLREAGSAGSHNGLRSIIGELETEKFARLRIGIGDPRRNATEHVLSRFGSDERTTLNHVIDAAADAVEDWARDGVSRAANRWNTWEVESAVQSDRRPPTESPVSNRGEQSPDSTGVVRTRTGWRRLLPR